MLLLDPLSDNQTSLKSTGQVAGEIWWHINENVAFCNLPIIGFVKSMLEMVY
jgi:hypothetical protein